MIVFGTGLGLEKSSKFVCFAPLADFVVIVVYVEVSLAFAAGIECSKNLDFVPNRDSGRGYFGLLSHGRDQTGQKGSGSLGLACSVGRRGALE